MEDGKKIKNFSKLKLSWQICLKLVMLAKIKEKHVGQYEKVKLEKNRRIGPHFVFFRIKKKKCGCYKELEYILPIIEEQKYRFMKIRRLF